MIKAFKRSISVVISLVMLLALGTALPETSQLDMTVSAADTFVPRTTEPSRSDPNYTANNPFYQSGYGMPN